MYGDGVQLRCGIIRHSNGVDQRVKARPWLLRILQLLRPSDASDEETVAKVENFSMADRLITIDGISTEVRISNGSVVTITHEQDGSVQTSEL